MSKVKRVKISELKPDVHNANKGTERGVYMLGESLRQNGAGRSILIDRDGNVIAGNKTLERAADLGFEEVIVVPTDGKTLVAVQREDLDLYGDERARLLAYYDNRTSEVDLAWEAEQLLADQAAGVDLSGLWHDDELEKIIMGATMPGDDDWMAAFETGAPGELDTKNITFTLPKADAEMVLSVLEQYDKNKNAALIKLCQS